MKCLMICVSNSGYHPSHFAQEWNPLQHPKQSVCDERDTRFLLGVDGQDAQVMRPDLRERNWLRLRYRIPRQLFEFRHQ